MDGTVYVGTKAGYGLNADFLAINPDGTLKWKYTVQTVHGVPDDIYTPAAVGADGKVYFGAETGFIYALNPDGTLAWKYQPRIREDTPERYIKGGAISGGGAALHSDGTLYFVASFSPPGGWVSPQTVVNVLFAFRTDSPGLANSAWPKFQYDNQNTGRATGPR